MKRIRSHYHNLYALKDAHPKFPRAIIANSNKELLQNISECALNVIKVNVKLSNCMERKLHKFRRVHRTVVDKHVPLDRKKKLILQSVGSSYRSYQWYCL